MARPKKQGVDYYPHDTDSMNRRTVYILESRFGNDGYAFWFKLLEILGQQDGLYYDCRNDANWEFLLAKTRLGGGIATEILDTLVKVDAIDAELWEKRVIWCQNFVNRLADVYKNRKVDPPTKPSFWTENYTDAGVSGLKTPENCTDAGVSTPKSTQRKVKESKDKVKDSTESESVPGTGYLAPNSGPPPEASAEAEPPSPLQPSKLKRFIPPSVDEVRTYCVDRQNEIDAENFVNFYTAKGWMIGRNKMQDWKAAVRTWEKKERAPNGSRASPSHRETVNERNNRIFAEHLARSEANDRDRDSQVLELADYQLQPPSG
jgi:hypothetical protein